MVLTPPFCSRLSTAASTEVTPIPASHRKIVRRTTGGKVVSLPSSGAAQTRRHRETAPKPFPTGDGATIRAAVDEEALAASSGDDDDDSDSNVGDGIVEGYSYFGEVPRPDPESESEEEGSPPVENESQRDISGEFVNLFVNSRATQRDYPKVRKIKVFYEAVTTVDKLSILGNTPSEEVNKKFMLWRDARNKKGNWTLRGIAESVYTIAKHVHDDQEKREKAGLRVSTDSKVIALVLMYKFFVRQIDLAETVRQSQNKVVAESLSSRQVKASAKAMGPLPANFRYDASKVSVYCLIFYS